MYFDSFGIEYIPQDVISKSKDKPISRTTYLECNLMILLCEFYCIACKEYMIAGKALLDHRNLFSPKNYQKNDKIVCKYF